MSDPSEATKVNPHPVSQHRTPREIAADEAGPIGRPDLDVMHVIAKDVPNGNSPRKPAAKRAPRSVNSKRPKKRR
jgi:hypothetical protein